MPLRAHRMSAAPWDSTRSRLRGKNSELAHDAHAPQHAVVAIGKRSQRRPSSPSPTLGDVQDALIAADLRLNPAAVHRLAAFLDALLRANARLNLTSITDPGDALVRHVIEPLVGWRLLAPRLASGSLFDVGSGGGTPGLPIAIADPSRDVVLVEARRRKADYLQATVEELALSNVRVVQARAEAVARGRERGTAAAAVARALAPLPAALELLLPIVAVGGWAAVFAGPALASQMPPAVVAASHLGAEPPLVLDVTWAGSSRAARLALTRKRVPTPDRFPRSSAARRRPLG